MPTPPRALTNDYRDCQLLKLDANDPNSPFVVVQEGYAPGDQSGRMRMFYLQRDGFWIDEIARSTRPDSELDDVVFGSSLEVTELLSGLIGRPLIRQLPVTDADIQAYLTRVKSISSPEAAFREVLARYRATKGK
jgi:hypothetical protein